MKQRIENKLYDVFDRSVICVEDVSYLHKGHLAHDAYETHFQISFTTTPLFFLDMSLLLRQKMIHSILAQEIKQIHSLSIKF